MNKWRVGTKVGRTLYLNDQLVGLMDTPELAAAVVSALSSETAPTELSPRELELIEALRKAHPLSCHDGCTWSMRGDRHRVHSPDCLSRAALLKRYEDVKL